MWYFIGYRMLKLEEKSPLGSRMLELCELKEKSQEVEMSEQNVTGLVETEDAFWRFFTIGESQILISL